MQGVSLVHVDVEIQNKCGILCVNVFRVNTPRKQGGLGDMKIPLLSDKNCSIAKSYGVYKEDEGVTFRFVSVKFQEIFWFIF